MNNKLYWLIRNDGTNSKGYYNINNNSFTIVSGSIIHVGKRNSYMIKEHNDLMPINDELYKVTKDIQFPTPSYACRFACGICLNGWVIWKDEDGKTLSDIIRL